MSAQKLCFFKKKCSQESNCFKTAYGLLACITQFSIAISNQIWWIWPFTAIHQSLVLTTLEVEKHLFKIAEHLLFNEWYRLLTIFQLPTYQIERGQDDIVATLPSCFSCHTGNIKTEQMKVAVGRVPFPFHHYLTHHENGQHCYTTSTWFSCVLR